MPGQEAEVPTELGIPTPAEALTLNPHHRGFDWILRACRLDSSSSPDPEVDPFVVDPVVRSEGSEPPGTSDLFENRVCQRSSSSFQGPYLHFVNRSGNGFWQYQGRKPC